MLRFILAGGVSAAAIFATGSAVAQTQPQSVTVGEVIVTAERRVQSVQKSSLAISVHSDTELKNAGVTQARDITKLEPGVQIGQGGPATQIYIRGVGDFGSTPVTNPAVATHVDGVYIARANSISGVFYDLERIEVLKGPQGTLYGRNATGGAINILTQAPRLGQLGGHVEAELGDYSLVRTEGALNVPVGDNLAFRGAFQAVSRNGYASQDYDDDKEWSWRLSGLYKPTDDLNLRLTVDQEHQGGNGPAYVWKGPIDPAAVAAIRAAGQTIPNNARLQLADPRIWPVYYATAALSPITCVPNGVIPVASATKSGVLTLPQGYCGPGFGSVVQPPTAGQNHGQDNTDTNVTAEMNYNLGWATLTVLPAYRHVRNEYTVFPLSVYHDGALGQPEISDSYSAEIRLGNSTPTLTWVAGVYGFREAQNASTGSNEPGELNIGLVNGSAVSYMKVATNTKAAFGQITYSITEPWRIIVGGRYSEDQRRLNGYSYVFDTPLSVPFAGACFGQASPCITSVYTGDKTWNKFTYKVGTEYDLSPDNMVFLTYSTGTKAGGFNTVSAVGDQAIPYNPEQLRAVEAGSRNRFFDRRLQVNFEGFYWKYKDAQETTTSIGPIGPQSATSNAGSATMYGLDTSIVARVTPHDTVEAAVELLHTRFDQFVYTAVAIPPNGSGCQIIAPVAPSPLQTINCNGKPLLRSPKLSGTVSYTHTFDLANGGAIDATWSSQFASSRELTVDYIPASRANGYLTSDVIVTYHSPDKKWSLAGFVRNISDQAVYTGAFSAQFIWPTLEIANINAPRTFGARLAMDF